LKIRTLTTLLVIVAATSLLSVAQTAPMLLPAPVEKELAARATNVTEVTLG